MAVRQIDLNGDVVNSAGQVIEPIKSVFVAIAERIPSGNLDDAVKARDLALRIQKSNGLIKLEGADFDFLQKRADQAAQAFPALGMAFVADRMRGAEEIPL